MSPKLYQVEFDGALLARGFWLYVWEIKTHDGRMLYYVGRTGDKASGVSQSPFDRLSKHLGSNKNNNALRRHLGSHELRPQDCSFRFHTLGPLLVDSDLTHGEKCDVVSALEMALASDLKAAGYEVLNQVNCRFPLDRPLWEQVRNNFGSRFAKLASVGRRTLPRGG